MPSKIVIAIVCFGSLCVSAAALAAGDDFSANPLSAGSPWAFGVGSNANSQFTWSAGSLSVHLNSSLPSARLDLPLGMVLDDSSTFELQARFSFHITSAPSDQAANMGFGLTNHLLTGGDRTGTFGNFSSDNTFNTVEWSYFPNVSALFGGPTLSPAVFGGHEPGGDAFANFTSVFGSASLLSDNSVGVTTLPQDTPLETHLAYDGSAKVLTLSMFQVVGNLLVPINTELVPLDLADFGSSYDPGNTFLVDSLSIMAYHDGFTTPDAPSVVGDMTFDSITLIVPEPSSACVALVGFACCVAGRVHGRARKVRRRYSSLV
jgi:hypothetical protein